MTFIAALLGASTLAHAQPPNVARDLAATCANCHGTNGHAIAGASRLAGEPADRLIRTFLEFRSGDRPATIMHQIAKGYTDEQIRLIADYFAAQK
ncbi:MAG: c-type cytochrome [Rhodocyclaceae bacterium]